ncbi:MAG: sodium-dependent transporter [Candidatus Kapabacteria bacterium]|nr:sodium-dependent transporter [Ignavibacteriota bacterium]MCW5884139.1 sodium-dependent transporter [Candidatus Kapabacteria bacterium]
MQNERGLWTSKTGFILAAAGSAVGLGNIWRFPYIVGENGGGAFVLIYLIFVLLLGLPYLMAEFSLGRAFQLNPVGAINKVKPNSIWRFSGYIGIATSIGILSFYGVIAGWTFGYIFKSFGDPITNGTESFTSFINNPIYEIGLFAFFIFLTALIVYKGVEAGIEKWSKILMPFLLVIMIFLIIYANMLPGASQGLEFYLVPDFSKISLKTILAALGQAFFSLSLGLGLMVTFGSYLPKSTDIFSASLYIVLFDALIAILGGLIVFPALFAMGENPASGPALVFIVFPQLFSQMAGGMYIGALFFVLLSIAALTSTVSLLEVPVSFIVDEKKSNRKSMVWKASFVVFIIGLPSALSQGTVTFFSDFGLFPSSLASPDFLSQMSFLFGDFMLTFGALTLCIFIGWVWGAKNASSELSLGSRFFSKFSGIWVILIKYIIPIIVLIILLGIFKISDMVE